MSQDLMNYDQMTQLALRGVVRDAIRRVIREDGLPGAHHFYITFLTRYPGVDIDGSLAEKYADEITIVIEHQYWDLKANADSFEVTLKFGGVPKFLSVPYTAVTRFHDPSVGFALQFDPPEQMEPNPQTLVSIAPNSSEKVMLKPKGKVKLKDKKTALKKSDAPKSAPAAKKPSPDQLSDIAAAPADAPADSEDASKVVSLDSFRKK